MMRFVKSLNKVYVITLFLTASFFQTASASIMEFLDEYEKVISVYEEYANKDKLCVSDMLKLNAEILPKLMPLMQQAQTQQSSFTPAELLRYMKIMTRYADALTDLGPKMENVTC